jgi:hypothetical protein
MPGFDGAAARRLDFGGITTTATAGAGAPARSRTGLRLAVPGKGTGADKYRELDLRRRRAQIAARHQLDLAEELDAAGF